MANLPRVKEVEWKNLVVVLLLFQLDTLPIFVRLEKALSSYPGLVISGGSLGRLGLQRHSKLRT